MRRLALILIAVLLAASVMVTCFNLGRASRITTTVAVTESARPAIASPKDQAPDVASGPDRAAADKYGPAFPSDHYPGAVPYSQTDDARARWEPVVVHFGHAFATTHPSPNAAAWRAGLTNLVTRALAGELATTDPAKIPAGTYDGWHVLDDGETQLTVEITYAEGWSVSIELITDGERWVVTRIEPA